MALTDDDRIEAAGMLREATAEVSAALERSLDGDCSMPVGFLEVLIRLARSPERQLRMTELAREMTISTSGLTRLVDRIEAEGLVERRRCPTDRRGLLAALTPAGEACYADVVPVHVAHLDEHLVRHLSEDELRQLTGLLRKLRDGVRGEVPDSAA